MANRLERALAGLGVGMTNASEMLLRQHLQDQLQTRYDERAREAQMATLERQGQMADKAAVIKALEDAANGGDPEAIAQRLTLLTGEPVSPMSLPRPSPRRRMDTRLGESIRKATNAEMVPTDEEILSAAKLEGLGLPDFATAGMEPTSFAGTPEHPDAQPDPFEYMGPVAQEFRTAAGARRRSWKEKPTEKVERQLPGGTTRTEFVAPYAGPVTTKPDATEQGNILGTVKKAELATAGPAMAAQAGAERTATAQAQQDVDLSPAAMAKKATQEGLITDARKNAEVNAEWTNLNKTIEIETKKALAKMQQVATEKEYSEWGGQIAGARESAQKALPVILEMRRLWQAMVPELEQWNRLIPDTATTGGQKVVPLSMYPAATRKYIEYLEAARPVLARMMGNVGNFTEGEQLRGGFIAPSLLDGRDGGKLGFEKLDRMEKFFLAGPSIAQANRPGAPPLTAEQVQSLINAWQRPTGDQKYDVLITPNGIVRPGGQ